MTTANAQVCSSAPSTAPATAATIARMSLAFIALLSARCLCTEHGSLGRACQGSASCTDGLVCVLLDEANGGGERVCVPMKGIDEPLACAEATECVTAGYPVDATCVDGQCACVGDAFACASDSVIDAATCRCVFAPEDPLDAGTDDAGTDDAGTDDAGQ